MSFREEREALVERLIKGMAADRRFRFTVVICFWDNADLSFHTGSTGPVFQRVALRVTELIKKTLKIKDSNFEGSLD